MHMKIVHGYIQLNVIGCIVLYTYVRPFPSSLSNMHGTLEKGGLFAHVSLPSFLQADDIATAGEFNI